MNPSISTPSQKGFLPLHQLDGTPQTLEGTPEAWRESGRQLFKPQTVLLRWRGLRGGGSKSGDSQTLGTGVVLGEPGFDLGERGRRDPPAAKARRGESLFSRDNVGDEIGHDLREGVSIDRNTLLCLPFHCVLCQAAPAPAGIFAILHPRYHPAHAARNSVSTPQPPTGQMVTILRGAKSQVCDRQERRSGTDRAVLGYALMPPALVNLTKGVVGILTRSLGNVSRKFFPQSHIASMIGFRAWPRLEMEYSTFGGT
jgi:hypothetical protein